jgi:phospholipid/cholesterol/gamma-HCH transport system ATP-binding protein
VGIQRSLHLTSVVVTHYMNTAFAVSDRLAMLGKRRVTLVGTKEDFHASTEPSIRNFIDGRAPEGEDVASLLATS